MQQLTRKETLYIDDNIETAIIEFFIVNIRITELNDNIMRYIEKFTTTPKIDARRLANCHKNLGLYECLFGTGILLGGLHHEISVIKEQVMEMATKLIVQVVDHTSLKHS